MFSIGFVMTLKSGCYEAYKEAHDKIWPDIAESMHCNHINMAIFHFGDHLFVHATAPTKNHWDRSRQDAALSAWQEKMTALLEDDAKGNVIVHPLEVAFVFGQFKND